MLLISPSSLSKVVFQRSICWKLVLEVELAEEHVPRFFTGPYEKSLRKC